jgi:hypothetical protein
MARREWNVAQSGQFGWLRKSAGTRTSTRELARSGKKKPQPRTAGVSLLVEAAGIEPASASTPPLALHAYPALLFSWRLPGGRGKPTAIPVWI